MDRLEWNATMFVTVSSYEIHMCFCKVRLCGNTTLQNAHACGQDWKMEDESHESAAPVHRQVCRKHTIFTLQALLR